MAIEMIGIDHTLAPIDRRTVFSFTKKQTAEFLTSLKATDGIEGCVLLSTCNRTEVWVSTSAAWNGDLYRLLCAIKGVEPDAYRDCFVFRKEQEAVRHLFYLAGGLLSRILGEDQILTQIGEALSFSRQLYATDAVTETLFRRAVTGGKNVKTEVFLSAADTSVVHTAIEELSQKGLTFPGKHCLVIGNGAMAKLAAELLCDRGAIVTMTVRQYRSGLVDIPPQCARIDYGKRGECIPETDIIVSATASPNYTLTLELVKQSLSKPAIFLDLAVPRDIDPQIGMLPGVQVYDVDSFQKTAQPVQQQAIAQAKQILLAQMEEFYQWYEGRDLLPDMELAKHNLAADVSLRLTKQIRVLSIDKSEADALSEAIFKAAYKSANKLLFGLKNDLSQDTFRESLNSINRRFLSEQTGNNEEKTR